MSPFLSPIDNMSLTDKRRGLRALIFEGMFPHVMVTLTTGAFLISFALAIQDSNKLVGLILSIGPLAMVIQTPAAIFIERFRRRKLVAFITAGLSRLIWPFVALAPFLLPARYVFISIILLLAARFALENIAGCAWGSWMRDLVPDRIMGRIFSIRMSLMIGVGTFIAFGSGVFVDYYQTHGGSALTANAIVIATGGFFGLVGLIVLARIPEPRMTDAPAASTAKKMLIEPFKDKNYRNWLIFVALWNIAVGISAPFTIVHMLKRLGLTMTWVQGLSMLAQLLMVALLPLWGKVADRLGSKTVLRVSTYLIVLTFLLWTFTAMPDRHALMFPVLILLHIVAGIAWGGFLSGASVLPLKNAPKESATSYMSANALVGGIAATIGPLTGGFLADAFRGFEFSIPIRFAIDGKNVFSVPAFSISGYDFLFIISFLIGSLALRSLKNVREKVETSEDLVKPAMIAELQRMLRQIGHTMGSRLATAEKIPSRRASGRLSARASNRRPPSKPAA